MAALNLAIMCQKVKFVLTCAFVLFIQIFFAQVTITIPNENPPTNTVSVSNVEHRKPLGSYFGYERTAFIYRHDELGMYGQITGIAIYCDSVNHPGNVPLNVYIRETSDSAFTVTTTVANEEAGATLVYTGTIQATSFAKGQWVSINFNTPFTHATSKPVEFIFETNASGSGSEGISGKFFSHYNANPNYYTTQYWDQDNTPPAGNGIVANCKPNAQITMVSIPVCSGMPNGGTTISSASDTLCLNENFVLSLQGNTSALGLSYQWQKSTNGVSFTNIPQADSTYLVQTMQDTVWYRCAVTCSGQTAYSTVKQIMLSYFMKCYCNNLGGGCTSNTAIDSVAIENTTLANGLTGCSANSYIFYPATGNTTTALNLGAPYTLDTRFNGNVSASFWIDYNRNGVLETSEWKQICLQSPSIYDTATVGGVLTTQVDSLFKTTFTVPANAQVGYTLMRVRSRASGNPNDTSTVCTAFGSGETEDYYVYINDPLGIQTIENNKYQISVYPNPATDKISIVTNPTLNENIITSIYSINGSLVLQTENKYMSNPLSIDVSALDAGIYFLKIYAKEYTTTKKIIIEK